MNRRELYRIISSEDEVITWCQNRGILNADLVCGNCDGPMGYDESTRMFRCNKRSCALKIGITKWTIFEKSKIGISCVLHLIFEWTHDTSVRNAAEECNVSQGTVSNWFAKFRRLSSAFYYLTEQNPIGGLGTIVEVDETLLVKNKFRRGRVLRGQRWNVAGIVRGNHECFCEFVTNRNRDTLIELLRRWILPGTVICTDGWRGYLGLENICSDLNFSHIQVNHSKNFVNPENRAAHTQNIEAFWSALKRRLRSVGGTNYINDIDNYVGEHLYKRRFRPNLFDAFITHINELHE